jgi:hypothetical protein
MRRLFVFLIFTFNFSLGQSLWVEVGGGWLEQLSDNGEQASQIYDGGIKFGARAVLPVAERAGLYVAPYYLRGLNVDAGAWFTLPLDIQDVEGFSSYLGAGLAFTTAEQFRFGFALSGALSYDLSDDIALALIYTHRPLLTPQLSQGFDVSVGLKVDLGE